ncbi:MAG TPA: flagellar biosynthetic protein FliR [Steroidobacteraceae bacterium]|nr:flagellar biosynthetic protein FliR [Steroidobacteraceae bacterium]
MQFNAADLVPLVQSFFWPFLRVVGFVLVAPIFGAAVVPGRTKVIVALALGILLTPVAYGGSSQPPPIEIFSAAFFLTIANQILVGAAIGFVVQLIFDALVIGGQTIAMTMGLGFATLIDSLRGASVPVVSQFMLVFGLLIYLALNGHIALIATLAESFRWAPVGTDFSATSSWHVAEFAGYMFSSGVLIALPAIVALVIVNFGLGVVSRAAPSLNLFAIGFPVTMLFGFLIVILSVKLLPERVMDMVEASLEQVRLVVTAR